MLNNHVYKACFLVLLSGFLYGFLGYFGTKILQQNMSVQTMLAWRFSIAAGWMLLFSIKNSSFKKKDVIDKQFLLAVFIMGAMGYAGSSLFYFLASQYIGTGLAMVIFFSYPVAVALFSWVAYKKMLNAKIILLLLLMLVGLFLLQPVTKAAFNFFGILFAILAAISYAFYIIRSKQFSAMDSNLISLIVCCSCAIIFLVWSMAIHSISWPNSLNSWLYVFALGILATAVPIQLMLLGLKHMGALHASIISVLEPLVTVFVGILWLHESLSMLQMLGMGLVLCSVIVIQTNDATLGHESNHYSQL